MMIRISEVSWLSLCQTLLARSDVESAGLLFGEPIETATGTVIAIREALVVPDEAYRIRRRDQISLDPVAMNRLTRRARDRGWSVLTIHTHPGASEPWFSAADDAGDARLMPSLRCQIPDAVHGSIVVVDGGVAAARVFDNEGRASPVALHVIGRTISRPDVPPIVGEPWFARQELALGPHGQRRLRSLRIAVVGLGGIGSLTSMQLAHLGVGELVLIDGDLVEESNLSRIVGATFADCNRSYKVDVAGRYAESVGVVKRVERHREYVDAVHLPLLASCDAILSCVDRHAPRALLNRIAYQSLTPVIDLGTVFRVDSRGVIVDDAGRVVVVGPGRPCLACWGHIDPHALRIEALPPDDHAAAMREGYIEGAVVAQPSVIAFNTHVAGAGVVEVLRLATGFAGSESPPLRLAFSFGAGTVRRNTLAGDSRCTICSSPHATPITNAAPPTPADRDDGVAER